MISKQQILAFKQRAVRDLAWALFNPPLFEQIEEISDEWLTPVWQDSAVLAWLQTLDKNPHELLEHLKTQRATRLGIYFEQLLSFYFDHYPRFSLVAKNLQANSPQRTIGEYDFIVWDKELLKYYHIEVAIKFYIGLQDLDREIPKNSPIHNWHLWVGPNKKDTLGIKMNHLLHHQLCLSDTKAGTDALASIGLVADQLHPKLLLTGRLYYPEIETPSLDRVTPPRYNTPQPLPQQALWVSPDRLNTILDDQYHYIILPRQLWMSDITPTDAKAFALETMPSTLLIEYVQLTMARDDTPLHIAAINTLDNTEKHRFFVIP